MGFLIRPFLVILLGTVIACGARSTESGPAPSESAMVQVQNQSFSDMVVYAVSGGQRIRLGLATGNSTKSFPIPQHLVRTGGTIRFQADPVGSNRAPLSEEMTVQPGDVVSLTIPPQ
jgi:hypothetical protein